MDFSVISEYIMYAMIFMAVLAICAGFDRFLRNRKKDDDRPDKKKKP